MSLHDDIFDIRDALKKHPKELKRFSELCDYLFEVIEGAEHIHVENKAMRAVIHIKKSET